MYRSPTIVVIPVVPIAPSVVIPLTTRFLLTVRSLVTVANPVCKSEAVRTPTFSSVPTPVLKLILWNVENPVGLCTRLLISRKLVTVRIPILD